MNPEQTDDVLWTAVAGLPTIALNEERSEQVRTQCRRALERVPKPSIAAEPLSVGTVCAMYAWHILARLILR